MSEKLVDYSEKLRKDFDKKSRVDDTFRKLLGTLPNEELLMYQDAHPSNTDIKSEIERRGLVEK